jgi:hypothetical protein
LGNLTSSEGVIRRGTVVAARAGERVLAREDRADMLFTLLLDSLMLAHGPNVVLRKVDDEWCAPARSRHAEADLCYMKLDLPTEKHAAD